MSTAVVIYIGGSDGNIEEEVPGDGDRPYYDMILSLFQGMVEGINKLSIMGQSALVAVADKTIAASASITLDLSATDFAAWSSYTMVPMLVKKDTPNNVYRPVVIGTDVDVTIDYSTGILTIENLSGVDDIVVRGMVCFPRIHADGVIATFA